MRNIVPALGSVFGGLSDQNYEKSFAFFRLWFGIGQAHSQIPPDLILDVVYENRARAPSHSDFICLTAHLLLRFIGDVELDPIFAPHSAGLRGRFCTRILQDFFDTDLGAVYTGNPWSENHFYMDANLIAHCANLKCIEEDTIRNQILQSLISHHKLYEHQAVALAILFKIAGVTFEACANPASVGSCFELLKNYRSRDRAKATLIRVSAFSVQRRWNC